MSEGFQILLFRITNSEEEEDQKYKDIEWMFFKKYNVATYDELIQKLKKQDIMNKENMEVERQCLLGLHMHKLRKELTG